MSPIYFSYNDFSPTNKKTHDLHAVHSSGTKEISQLKQDKLNYKKGSKWLIKSNQFTWIAHEYVTSKLYQIVLGKGNVTDTVLVQNHQSPLKPMLAVKLHKTYEKNFIPFNRQLEANGFKAKCLVSNKTCYYKQTRPVFGFEKALSTSMLFDDADIDDVNNFALKLYKDYVAVTRYDFDDSFKFFAYLSISDTITEDSLNQEARDFIAKSGSTIEKYLQLLKTAQQVKPQYRDCSWNSFLYRLGAGLDNGAV